MAAGRATGSVEAWGMGMSKPRVLVLADVPNWCWRWKSDNLRRYLSDEFAIDVKCRAHYYLPDEVLAWDSYDLVHTFEVAQVIVIPECYRGKLISGITAHVIHRYDENNPGYGPAKVRAWASRCDALHANSLFLMEEIRPYHDRVWYTPNGVDVEFWKRTRPRATEQVTFSQVGKPKSRKGFPLIRDMCDRLGASTLNVYRTAHQALTPEQVRDVYEDVWCQVIYSDKDGTPNSALESAAMGNALLSNPIGNMPEMIVNGYNGFLIPREPEAFEERLRWMMANPREVVQMGVNARRMIEAGWSWQMRSQHVRAMWREVLSL